MSVQVHFHSIGASSKGSSEKTDFMYVKPREICYKTDSRTLALSDDEFTSTTLKIIERSLASKGLYLRRAVIADVEQLFAFIKGRYPSDIAEEISAYDMYRFIKFGHGLVIRKPDSGIVACLFEVGYDTPERTSYTLRLGVDQSLSGLNVGQALIEYSCILAMQRGSGVKRGLLDLENYTSAHILINKVGWIAEAFYPDLKPLGACFTICLPLDRRGFLENRIDFARLQVYIDRNTKNRDYMIVSAEDVHTMNSVYQDGFKVVAYLKKGIITDENSFFLLPQEILYNNY